MARLIDLDGLEVSLVPRGANKKKFFLTKEDEDSIMSEEIKDLFEEVLKSDLENADEVEEILKAAKLSDKGTAAVKGALKLLGAVKGEIPEGLREKLAGLVGYGYPPPAKKQEQEEYKMPKMKEDGSFDFTGVNDEIREPLEALWKANQDNKEKLEAVTKENTELKDTINKERDEKLTREYVAKAAEFKNLGINAEEYGPVLKKLAESDKDAYDKHLAVLKAADEGQGKLFTEAGASGESTVGSAEEKINKAAEAIMKEDKTVTKEQAFTRALEQNPGLYDEYMSEK